MRQRYTKEIEACDLLQGGKQVMVQELDVIGADHDARAEVATSLGPSAQLSGNGSQSAERLLGEYEHPAHIAAAEFRAYVGPRGSAAFDYNSALRVLQRYLDGQIRGYGHTRTEDELVWHERAKLHGGAPFAIESSRFVFGHHGAERALAYLRSLDTSGFNCADRAFYNEFLERIEKAQAKNTPAVEGAPATPQLP